MVPSSNNVHHFVWPSKLFTHLTLHNSHYMSAMNNTARLHLSASIHCFIKHLFTNKLAQSTVSDCGHWVISVLEYSHKMAKRLDIIKFQFKRFLLRGLIAALESALLWKFCYSWAAKSSTVWKCSLQKGTKAKSQPSQGKNANTSSVKRLLDSCHKPKVTWQLWSVLTRRCSPVCSSVRASPSSTCPAASPELTRGAAAQWVMFLVMSRSLTG